MDEALGISPHDFTTNTCVGALSPGSSCSEGNQATPDCERYLGCSRGAHGRSRGLRCGIERPGCAGDGPPDSCLLRTDVSNASDEAGYGAYPASRSPAGDGSRVRTLDQGLREACWFTLSIEVSAGGARAI